MCVTFRQHLDKMISIQYQFFYILVNSDVSKIKTVLKVCNVYESCSITEGPEISVRHPTQISDADVM